MTLVLLDPPGINSPAVFVVASCLNLLGNFAARANRGCDDWGREKMRKLLCAFFVLTLALGLAASGWGQAQISTATAQGDVLDEKGGSVAGASVEAKNLDTNLVRTETTDTDG